ncbi:CHASE2 domain-containing protein [Candidatus Riflebacteria bacterium]
MSQNESGSINQQKKEFSSRAIELKIFFSVFFLTSIILLLGGFEKLENDSMDLRFRIRGEGGFEQKEKIIIVGINSEDIAKLGPLPWDRMVFARLLQKFKQFGAKACAIDVLFNEEGRNAKSDIALGKAIAEFPAVLPIVFILQKVLNQDTYEFEERIVGEKPIPIFAKGAKSLGFIDVELQKLNYDGILRHFLLEKEIYGEKFQSMDLALFNLGEKELKQNYLTRFYNLDIFNYSQDGKFTFFDLNVIDSLIINYRGGHGSFSMLPVHKVLEIEDMEFGKNNFKDKYVYIGAYEVRGLKDVKTTPFGPMAGVEIHANVLNTLLQRKFIIKPTFVRILLILFLVGLLNALLLKRFNNWFINLLYLTIPLSYFLFSCFMLLWFSVQVPYLAVTFLVIIQFLITRFVQSYHVQTLLALKEEKTQTELGIARDIQKLLFPEKMPQVEGYDLFGYSLSADAVGGDYFDFIILDKKRIAIIIGDVSGHGIGAALPMAMAKSGTFLGLSQNITPSNLLLSLNKLLFDTLKRKRMMTYFVAILDTTEHKVDFSNAGHNYPIIYTKGGCKFLQATSYPLGIKKRGAFTEVTRFLEDEDVMCFYTDGAIESTNREKKPYGYERLKKYLQAHRRLTAKEIVENFFVELEYYAAGEPYDDDISMAIVKRL